MWSLSACRLLDVGPHFSGVGKDVFESFFEAIDIVVDQVLSMDFALIDEADEGETLVDLAQV